MTDEQCIPLKHSLGKGFVIPLGSISLVGVVAKNGMVGCGAIDVTALGKFGYAAARVRPTRGPSVAGIEDLLVAEVKEANEAALRLGIQEGMTGKDALDLLS
ncbi:MAG: YunC family protein [Methanolinea sp.]|nr:YunC family protein [Methanolinea sp.]